VEVMLLARLGSISGKVGPHRRKGDVRIPPIAP
jgi:hypothetical protein